MSLLVPGLRFIPSRYGGGAFSPQPPSPIYLLNHSLQAPDVEGMAESLAEGWFQNPDNQTSVHALNDRGSSIQTRDLLLKAWGCGNGNEYTYQFEHVGYAEWSYDQWRTTTMLACMRVSAKTQAWVWYTQGIQKRGYDYYPEWLSLTQIAEGKIGGLMTHNDARQVWGGTTHTDPGKNFFYAELKNEIWVQLDKLTGWNKTGNSNYKPEPPADEEDDMISNDQVKAIADASAQATVNALMAYKMDLSDAYAAEEAKRNGVTYSPKPVPFKSFLETVANRATMGARDSWALRNLSSAAENIVGAVKAMLMNRGSGTVRDSYLNWIWDVKIGAEKPNLISFGEALRRTWKAVTGSTSSGTTTAAQIPNGTTDITDGDTDDNA